MKQIALADLELGPVLGVGTVGTVYRGIWEGRTVAVKLLHASISTDELIRARFRREMEILEKLEHPHIIRYLGGGERDGQLYYVMEAVEGGTSQDLLTRFGPLSWQEVASIGRQVCSALQHAHNHGIIHRDLKPSNLFLDHEGNVRLGDFGIARDTNSADITSQGLTVGTHAYMSPEQITGEQHVTGKADLYSLGCVLFELLTGNKPFEGSNFAVLFEQHLRKDPPRAADAGVQCPAKLSEIIDQLLRKNPEERPFNARSVQGALLELLATDAASDRQSSRSHRSSDARDRSAAADADTDVGAAAVMDPGMERLTLKLGRAQPAEVSWKALLVLGAVLVVAVTLAAVWSR